MIEAGRGRSYIYAAVLVIVSTLSYGQSGTDDGSADLRPAESAECAELHAGKLGQPPITPGEQRRRI